MAIELTKEEKLGIINSHQRTAVYNKYNYEMSLLQESSKSNPDESTIAKLNSDIVEATRQIDALQAEIDKLN
jgi:SMC interacting uncharacterized protein involved in chromosome segregation